MHTAFSPAAKKPPRGDRRPVSLPVALRELHGRPFSGCLLWISLALVGLIGSTLLAQVSVPATTLTNLQERTAKALDEGRQTSLDVLAPKNFERAHRAFEDAEKLFKDNGDSSLVALKFKVALEELETGREMAKRVRDQVPTVLAARLAARDAGADSLVPTMWQRAEQQLSQIIRDVESGTSITAASADDIAGSYRAARRDALRRAVLNDAWELRDEMDRRNGEKLTPVLSLRVHQAISRTEAALAQDNLEVARAEGANATRLARRTLDIIKHIERAQKSDAPWESAILPYNDVLDTVAHEFDATLDYSNGVAASGRPLLDQISHQQDSLRNRIAELEASHRSMEESLSEAQTSLADAQNRILELERRMGAAENERNATRSQLQLSDQLSRAVNHFAPGEATVQQNDRGQIVICLLALRFASGATKLDKPASKLLDKAAAAITEFPGAKIAVEGHTDAEGGASANQQVSSGRATAVRNYLSTALKIPKDQIAATGFGESRPIADNNTREGKAMNRRIEIVLTLQ